MKGVVKGLIAGIIIILIGVTTLIIALALNGWQWKAAIEFEMQTYEAESDVSSVNLNIDFGRLVCEYYDGDKIQVEYPTADGINTSFNESGNSLTVTGPKYRWWRFTYRNLDMPQTTVKLPIGTVFDILCDLDAGTAELGNGDYGTVTVNIDAGTFHASDISAESMKIDIDAGTVTVSALDCNKFECDIDAGTVDISNLTCPSVNVDADAGTVKIGLTDAKEEYTILTDISAGSCNVGSQIGTTEKIINVNLSAGTIKFGFGN